MNLNHFPSVGTFHGTSLQKESHLIKSAFLRVLSCFSGQPLAFSL